MQSAIPGRKQAGFQRWLPNVCSILLIASLVFSSCKHVDPPIATSHTITDILLVNNSFTFLRAAVQRAGMTDMLRTGTYTVFAPTDDAFRASGYADVAAINQLPVAAVTALVQYHITARSVPASAIQGGQTTSLQTLLPTNGVLYVSKVNNYLAANGHLVTTSDVAADNGVMHVVSTVLSPPALDAISTIQSDPQNFSLLAAAVQRAGAGLLTTLQSTTAATIFAPTNEAFLTSGFSSSAIASASPAVLQRLLTYHILPGRFFSSQFINAQTPKTLLGSTIRLNVLGTSVSITALGDTTTAATVIRPDILSTNAVIHGIDRVLLPPP